MTQVIDLTGKRFGKLTVLEHCGSIFWKCKCDCGNIKIIRGQSLREGKTISCGCKKRKDLVGKRFGRLVVIKRLGFINRQTYYECKCDCGNIVKVTSSNLTKGNSTSCGCYAKELASQRQSIHKMSNTRLYKIWEGIKQRCYNSHTKQFKYYGAKGISLCDEWFSFENFKNWSLRNGYQDNLSIDRIDFNGNYCPNNCRWTNKAIQANNTKTNIFITYKGQTETIANWSRKTNIKAATIYWRYHNGWSIEDCLNLKPGKSRSKSD